MVKHHKDWQVVHTSMREIYSKIGPQNLQEWLYREKLREREREKEAKPEEFN